jgi:hypothetical protein
MTRTGNLVLAAAALVALAGLILAGQILVVAAQTRDGAAPQRAPAFPAMEDLQATRDRPLFSPSRRPPDVPAPPEETSDAPPPVQEAASLPFELTGTVIGSEIKVAILRDRQTQEEVRLREGEEHGPWRIEEVAARHVLFRNEGRRVRLRLFDETAKAGDNVKVKRVGPDDEEAVTPAEPVSTETEAVEEEEVVPENAPEARPPSEVAPKPAQRTQRRNGIPNEVGGRQQPQQRRQLTAEQVERQQMREQLRMQRQQQIRQQARQMQGRQQVPR